MKNVAFSLTTAQIRAKTKDVTRRMSSNLKPGEHFRAVVKGMGLKKGEKVQPICELICLRNDRQPLWRLLSDPEYGREECRREGFPEMTPDQFLAFFCKSHGCEAKAVVHRIEFVYA